MSNHQHHDQQSPESANPGLALIVGVALILCAAWMVVWRGALEGAFHFDDYSNIVDNERIRTLWPLDHFIRNNRPVGLYSFAMNFHFSGKDPFAYHVTNLFIHMINGLLLMSGCLLSWRLYRRYWLGESEPRWSYSAILWSGLIATVWVVHPITTQAVTNVVQRYESLASTGYLGAWVGMLFYLDGRRWLGCTIMLPMAWVGLLSKEIFATAPLSILLLDRLITGDKWFRIARRRWFAYALLLSPFFWFIPNVLRFVDPVKSSSSSMGLGLKSISQWQYLRTQPEVIWHYLGLTVWPKDLCFDYVWRIQDNPWVYLSLGASILGLIVAGAAMYFRGAVGRRSFQMGLAGWLILVFFFVLAPTSSIMPIADIAVEHRMYLASAIVVAMIVLLAKHLGLALLGNSQRPFVLKIAYACIAVSLISLLSFRTHLRNLDYRDGLVLWTTATEVSPKNPRAWYSLGQEYIQRGDQDSALRPMVKAVGYSNESVPMFDVGLAECLYHIGRHEDAITLLFRAIEKQHNYPEAHNDLGVVYLSQGRLDEAQKSFETAINLGFPAAKYNLALVHTRRDETSKAVVLWEEILAEDPSLHAAARRLAWVLATTSDMQIRDLNRAEQLLRNHYAFDSTPTQDVLGKETIVERLPQATQSATVLDTWAAILAAKGDFNQAIEVAEQAKSIARSRSNQALAQEITQRLADYRMSEPCIDGVQP